jgi:DNA polymerase gamma 1
MECITPSHSTPIPPGECLDMVSLLNKGDKAKLDPAIVPDPKYAPKLDGIEYTPRIPVMQDIQDASGESMDFLKAQIINSDEELRDLMKDVQKAKISAGPKKEPSISKKSLNKVLPYHAYPHLMPMEEPMSVSEAMNAKLRNGYDRNKWHWPKNSDKGQRSPSSRV